MPRANPLLEQEAPIAQVQVADFTKRKAREDEIAQARTLLRERVAIASFEGSWKVLVAIEEGAPLLVDCTSHTVTDANADPADLDCEILVTPSDLAQIMQGGLDPRYLLLYQRIKVRGSTRAATKFCDAIALREFNGTVASGSGLPTPTRDLRLAKQQLKEFGYCLIADALSPQQLGQLRTRLVEQAEFEIEQSAAGRGTAAGGGVPPIQPVWALLNKGQPFIDLLDHPLIDEFGPEFAGEYFLLSSYTSKIAGPGCSAQVLHTDQIAIQPPIPGVNVGFNLFFFLDEFTDANGGTRIMPRSHLPENRVAPDDIYDDAGTIAAEGPAGTALIFDSRLWHSTGSNKTERKRRAVFMFLTRSWLRSMENWTISALPDVVGKCSDRVKTMLGFRCTGGLGGVEGPVEGEMVSTKPDKLIREGAPSS